MSRYVRVAVGIPTIEAIASALAALGISVDTDARGVMLQGSLECAGEPVELRVPAGVADAVEDFGFTHDADGHPILVCGDVDREVLTRGVLVAATEQYLRATVAELPGVRIVRNSPAVRVRSETGRESGSGGNASGE